MDALKKLVSQTAIYGLSSVLGRFLNYLLVPLYTYSFLPAEYGVVAEFYAYMGFLSVVLVFGLETGYFRFRTDRTQDRVFSTVLRTLFFGNSLFLLVVWLAREPIARWLEYPDQVDYVLWVAGIVALDAIGAAAFARLRAAHRALRFAWIKLAEIGINIGLNLFFLLLCRPAFQEDPQSFLGSLWNPQIGVGYVFLANLAASAGKLLLLAPELRAISAGFDGPLFRQMIRYSSPMVLIGLAGIVNEMLDRAALKYLLPYDLETNLAQLGIYSACYKLSILMTLFIQAFRYAGEPFFFAQATQPNARQTYALVLHWFVILCLGIFLLVSLYLEIFQYFVGAAYREGLEIVPLLLIANLLLGVYVNLSIWYKLSDRTGLGAGVALAGSVVTVLALFGLVPRYGYLGAAWAHLLCYSFMVLVSYGLGRRYYPVPYRLKPLFGYLGLALLLVYLGRGPLIDAGLPWWLAATLCFAVYLGIVYAFDGRKLRTLGQPA